MPDVPATPQFSRALEAHLRAEVRRRRRTRRVLRPVAAGSVAVALAIVTLQAGDRAARAQATAAVTLPDGGHLVVRELMTEAELVALERTFARAGKAVRVERIPAAGPNVGRVLAVRPPAGVPVDARGRFRLRAGDSGVTRILVGRRARPGEAAPHPLTTFEQRRGSMSVSRGRLRPAMAVAVAGLTVTAGAAAQAAELASGTAERRVTRHADGSSSTEITTADGRFMQRRYDREGRLAHELYENGRTVFQYDASSGRVWRSDSDGAVHDNRFERWERIYRAQIARGYMRVAGEVTIDGRRAYELALTGSPQGLQAVGQQPAPDRVFVDAETWVPLRSLAGDRVLMSTVSRIVQVADVEDELELSRKARAARRAAASARGKRRASRR